MGSEPHHFSKSIDQLEGSSWGEAPTDATNLVQRCHALRAKPLEQLTPEEIGLAIRQRVGIPFVLGLAVGLVREDPLFESENYPGDLLAALARLPEEDWRDLPSLRVEFDQLHARALAALEVDETGEWHWFAMSLGHKP